MSPHPLSPPIILLDSSALLAGRSQEWQTFSRLGDCAIPAIVWEELQVLCDRAPEPHLERAAREFVRFYPTSGWQIVPSVLESAASQPAIAQPTINQPAIAQTVAEHPLLQPAAGATLSQTARRSLAVAQTTYGIALQVPTRLVVLVMNNPGLLKQIAALRQPNLCGLPLAAWMQWVRTQRKPDAILHHLHQIRQASPQAPSDPLPATGMPLQPRSNPSVRARTPQAGSTKAGSTKSGSTQAGSTKAGSTKSDSPKSSTSKSGNPKSSSTQRAGAKSAAAQIAAVHAHAAPPPSQRYPPTPAAQRSSAGRSPRSRRSPQRGQQTRQFLVSLLMVLGLAIAGLAVWRTFHPQSFNRFLNQTWPQAPVRSR
jgi:hypothetical protein